MLFDPTLTKILTIAITLLMYALAIFERRLTNALVMLGLLYFGIGLPLGYDTLMYSFIISAGKLDFFGPLWQLLGFGATWLDIWWLPHLITFSVLVYSFAALAQRSAWPSLLFAMLVSLPGMGFDFLSIMRQGLSTAFVILFYISLTESRSAKALIFAALAALAHPVAIVVLGIITVFHSINNFSGNIKIFSILVLSFFAILSFAPDFFQAQIIKLDFLYSSYTNVDSDAEASTGFKLYLAWSSLTIFSIVFAINSKKIYLLSYKTFTSVVFLLSYGYIVTISGATARIIWLYLPFLSRDIVGNLSLGENYKENVRPVIIIFLLLCFSISAYVLSIAPEFYWQGAYDHQVYVR